jgi:hypothetical protein
MRSPAVEWVMGERLAVLDDDDRVGIAAPARAPNDRLRGVFPHRVFEERPTLVRLERGELEVVLALVVDDELHRVVAEVAGAVEEDHGAHRLFDATTGALRA